MNCYGSLLQMIHLLFEVYLYYYASHQVCVKLCIAYTSGSLNCIIVSRCECR